MSSIVSYELHSVKNILDILKRYSACEFNSISEKQQIRMTDGHKDIV